MAISKKYYGIKYPFTHNNEDGLFLDMDVNYTDKIASRIIHVILTQKRSRIRMPDFGTNLIHYIFEPSDNESWSDIVGEATVAVSKYVEGVKLKDMRVYREDEEDNKVFLILNYTVERNGTIENNELAVRIV